MFTKLENKFHKKKKRKKSPIKHTFDRIQPINTRSPLYRPNDFCGHPPKWQRRSINEPVSSTYIAREAFYRHDYTKLIDSS